MAITKTKFINYLRCPRYVSLEKIKKENLNSKISIEEYRKEQENEHISELLGSMDLKESKDEHLLTMLPYYNEVEILAGTIAPKYFKGTFKFSRNTYNQKCFDTVINGIRYMCYVDIYNDSEETFNIIECKATTDKKYIELEYNGYSIFKKDEKGIYRLLEYFDIDIEKYMPKDIYEKQREKLFDKYSTPGHYVYDLAIQRFIIDSDLNKHDDRKSGFFLAVLNSKYIFNGKYEKGKPIYDEIDGEDIISFIDLTPITSEYKKIIENETKKLEKYLNENELETKVGKYCERNKPYKCKYCDICYKNLPKEHSIFSYIDSHFGFKKGDKTYMVYDLINEGKVGMLDIDNSYLTRKKNIIQRKSVEKNTPYVNVKKIKDGLSQIKYPIYHLDFETFPCPLPRFKGESPYTQSVFQFSLHIEKSKGVCDKEKDHFGYLADNNKDQREKLVKYMCELIGDGTVMVYNDSFEKSRIKELAEIFPEYREKLLKINSQIFDLMDIVKTRSKLYISLGYSPEEAKMINYYNPSMDGSYSIKKILPIFSDLSYKDMEVSNGVEAMITYAKFPNMDKEEFKYKYQKLVEYCCQDTYAMFKVLEGLRKIINVK